MVLNKIWSISYQNKKYYGKTLNLWIYCVFVPCANFLAQGTVVSLTVYKSYLLRLEDYMSNTKTTFPLYYRGKPLVRNNDTIFFGDMKDPYVIKLQIKSKENSNNLDCANKHRYRNQCKKADYQDRRERKSCSCTWFSCRMARKRACKIFWKVKFSLRIVY